MIESIQITKCWITERFHLPIPCKQLGRFYYLHNKDISLVTIFRHILSDKDVIFSRWSVNHLMKRTKIPCCSNILYLIYYFPAYKKCEESSIGFGHTKIVFLCVWGRGAPGNRFQLYFRGLVCVKCCQFEHCPWYVNRISNNWSIRPRSFFLWKSSEWLSDANSRI